jgi:hypothetical protein
MKYPYNNVYSITCYDQVDKCVQQVFDFDCEDGLSVALSYGYDFTEIEEMERHICVPQNVHESALDLQSLQTIPHGNVFVDLVLSHKKLLPSILQAPELELKPLPDNLMYSLAKQYTSCYHRKRFDKCARGKTCEVVV